MAVSDRTLVVWSNQTKVGTLREHNNLWSFEYDSAWKMFDLCPTLPRSAVIIEDGSSKRPIQWFFDNLLPEEGARTLLAADADIDEADAFGLLAYFGAESAGALTLLGPDETPGQGGRHPLSFAELSARIKALPDVPLSQGGSKRMSLAGAQHKLPIIFDNGELFEPNAAEPSTHILKPNHSKPDQYPHSAINEFVMMKLARAVGLVVPEVYVIHVPEPAYLVERFDRSLKGNGMQRLHVIDTCQLLSLDRAFKYTQCLPDTLTAIVDQCRAKAATRKVLFDWFVFCLLIGNTDNHLKNLSFYMSPEGVVLTPHYDLLSTAVYEPDNGWLNARLEWKISSVRTLGEVSPAYLAELGRILKVPPRLQAQTVNRMVKTVAQQLPLIYGELQTTPYPTGVSKDGELRLLRQIQHGVIADMAARLAV
ncbi:MAG: type II toxin-antitoxin system HipA family toxin [Oceanospirillales bacterium]|nr:type II toxin-antitoxin system HipA family toxin [Oceanospirillales bacterium]